ncbi:MAG: hypothetical protein APR63_04380 [Desulfuromonas sp. SDB]|nr:MAG: hypothetical protein APR63_04380 [Desulfuromonas sp. SDB]
MQSKVITKYIRVTPLKARRVVDFVLGKPVDEAIATLSFSNYSISRPLSKAISSAAANLKMKPEGISLDDNDILVKEVRFDKGPSWPKRYRAGARGRAKPYVKRTCHLTVVVETLNKNRR